MVHPEWLEDLLEELVHRPLGEDARTVADPSTFLGWPKDRILDDVLGWGQADFDQPIGKLTPDDRALLYARYNLPRHLDELRAAFQQLSGEDGVPGKPTVIDLGCGPFTAGLAAASELAGKRPFRYFGLDRAKSMRRLGERFAADTRVRGAFHPHTSIVFADNLNTIEFGPIRGDAILAVASYLLSSDTLVIDDLVRDLTAAFARIGPGPVVLLYTNSAKPYPNRKYPEFRSALVEAGFEVRVEREERFNQTARPALLKYTLFYRPSQLEVTV